LTFFFFPAIQNVLDSLAASDVDGVREINYRVIKENDLFLTTDPSGDIPEHNPAGLGLYTRDTRFLSRMELMINGEKPVLLRSSAEGNFRAEFLLTNRHMEENGHVRLWRESVELRRTRFISDNVLYETVALTNFNPKPVRLSLSIAFGADFLDMFAVRGYVPAAPGKHLPLAVEQKRLSFHYEGTDGVRRSTVIEWDHEAGRAEADGTVSFDLSFAPAERIAVSLAICPVINGEMPARRRAEEAVERLERSYGEWMRESTQIRTDHVVFARMYDRSLKDMRVLLTDIGHGPFPVAGLPIFAVPFGRDSLIAALQMLPVNPKVALGTLRTMAATQGTKLDPWRDEEPGKIMHEMRYGELAATGRIPFNPYYGSIDSTPLFLVLLAEYVNWTGDLDTLRELMPNVEAALSWIERYGDADGDGFLEYKRKADGGLANQGWKDSGDSIVHESGDLGEPPIALVEVQGYVYHAKAKLAPLIRRIGRTDLAGRLEAEAAALKKRLNEAFWMDDHGTFALALDGEKRQVRAVTSNPGHLLMTGIVDGPRAAALVGSLTGPEMFSGYGIRTMGSRSTGYNPMSYHNGSVWPHDNAICLLGMSRTGFLAEAGKVMDGLLAAAEQFEYCRLPELFCGYGRETGPVIPYPVACSPQAWAAGTAAMMLQVMLGIEPDAAKGEIRINPVLPPGMNELEARGMSVAGGRLSIRVRRTGTSDFGDANGTGGFAWDVLENTTGCRVLSAQTVSS
jgi:glycogen debranching enzyme